jgi:FHA domain
MKPDFSSTRAEPMFSTSHTAPMRNTEGRRNAQTVTSVRTPACALHRLDCGYVLARPWWRQGLMTEVEGEGAPLWEPGLTLTDTMPFRLSRNHFIIELRDGDFHVRDLCSTLGTVVNSEPIGNHFPTDDALLRAGENEVVAGGMDSPFVFSVFIA